MYKLITIIIIFTSCKTTEMHPLKIGDRFPKIEATTLDYKKIIFPDSIIGKNSVLLIGFSQLSQIPITSWTNYILNNYPDLNFFEVPIGNVPFAFIGRQIDNSMRANVPTELHSKTATYYGNLCNTYKKQFNATNLNLCYLFLLDAQGNIVYKTSDELNQNSQDEFQKIIKNISNK